MSRKLCISLPLVLVVLLAIPAAGGAVVTFGSTVGGGPIGSAPSSCMTALAGVPVTCTVFNANIGDGGGVAPGGVHAPTNGVITRWRVTMGTVGSLTSMTAKPRILTPVTGNKFTAVRSGAIQTIPNLGGDLVFSDRIKVSTDDRFGLDITTVGSAGSTPYMVTSTSPISAKFIDISPPFAEGETKTFGAIGPVTTEKLQINADIEADVDNDGFGDESQDLCTSRADVQAICPPPLVSTPKFAKNAFGFTSDIPGKATTTLFKVSNGHKVGKKCKKGKAKKGKKSCKLYTKFAQWNDDVVAGANTISYSYKVGGKSLRKGKYRATIVITSAQGTVTTKTIDFSIKK